MTAEASVLGAVLGVPAWTGSRVQNKENGRCTCLGPWGQEGASSGF